jgi:hypothetical protein
MSVYNSIEGKLVQLELEIKVANMKIRELMSLCYKNRKSESFASMELLSHIQGAEQRLRELKGLHSVSSGSQQKSKLGRRRQGARSV